MFEVLCKKQLNQSTFSLEIKAESIAKNVLPGQFVIVMTDEKSERIPLTISSYNITLGSITVIFQAIGESTIKLSRLTKGEKLAHVSGPLGNATDLTGIESACVIGGGVGCAIALPEAKWLHGHGVKVDIIAGFSSKDALILYEEMKSTCENLIVCTDDGSLGKKGFVTLALEEKLNLNIDYDCVIAIGPIGMMKAVSDITKKYNIKTIVSLNPIMIDGTGMCGCCRVTVGGETKFACVDGPDFDAHQVDFDELAIRNRTYLSREKAAKGHRCRLYGEMRND
jgi:ferredoxin--NADP+ reductase